jgi:hypothetical protein
VYSFRLSTLIEPLNSTNNNNNSSSTGTITSSGGKGAKKMSKRCVRVSGYDDF